MATTHDTISPTVLLILSVALAYKGSFGYNRDGVKRDSAGLMINAWDYHIYCTPLAMVLAHYICTCYNR